MPTAEQVADWRRRHDCGQTCAAIAAEAGVNQTIVKRGFVFDVATGRLKEVTL